MSPDREHTEIGRISISPAPDHTDCETVSAHPVISPLSHSPTFIGLSHLLEGEGEGGGVLHIIGLI